MKFAHFGLLLLALIGTAEAGLSYVDMKALVREEGVKRTDRNLGITVSGEGVYTFAPDIRGETTEEEEKVFSEQTVADFSDLSSGYCSLDTFTELERLELLFNSDVADVDDFLQGSEAISALQGFVTLVRSYLPVGSSGSISDREILSSVMQQPFSGPTRALSQYCIDTIEDALGESLVYFNKVLNVGGGGLSAPDLDADPADDELVDTSTWPFLLQIIEQDTSPTFDKFKDFVLGYYKIFDAREYFDNVWRESVNSWQEATLSGIAVVAKFAAVSLTDGVVIQDDFLALNNTSELELVYADTVSICRGTGGDEPATGPGPGPAPSNVIIPLIAVIRETSSDLSASDLERSYDDLRSDYPDRPICLLQPFPATSVSLKVPGEFRSDGSGNVYRRVQSDGGSLESISNWFDLCDLYGYSGSYVALYISPDVASAIPASLNYFERQLAQRDLSIIDAVGDGSTNWIEPFIQDFV